MLQSTRNRAALSGFLALAFSFAGLACQAPHSSATEADQLEADTELASGFNAVLKPALAFGNITELNTLAGDIDPQLLLRLYQAPQADKDCFIETSGTCGFIYILSVSTYDEVPEIGLFRLENEGEISNITWQETSEIDTAALEFDLKAYTAAALKNNPKLSAKKTRIRLDISPSKIIETQLKP